MTGWMKITAIDQAEARKAMGDENASGFSVETRITHAKRADRVSLVMAVMASLQFDDMDRALLVALMMDPKGLLHKSMTVTMPRTEEG